MVNVELHGVLWSGKLSTFINPQDVYIVVMVAGELNEFFDELWWWKIWSSGISKEVTCGIINNGGVWGNVLAGEIVEEAEVKMKASNWI